MAHRQENSMKISARNILAGTVKHVEHGAVNTEVTIELPGGAQLISIITKASAERLQLAPGKKAHAVIKSSDVLVATDD
jgi:molybdopterin-binding protein